jgi:acyl-CoA thioesterase I
MNTLYGFGDSVLDCGVYNPHDLTPLGLLYRNHDELFPEFCGQDLINSGEEFSWEVRELARDGSLIGGLWDQREGVELGSGAISVISVGGNDFLQGLWRDDDGDETDDFLREYGSWLATVQGTRLICNVYDPFFGENMDNGFFGRRSDYNQIRRNYERLNRGIEELARRYGQLVNLRDHFLKGDPSWFVRTIEPSLQGASEIRRVLWGILKVLKSKNTSNSHDNH